MQGVFRRQWPGPWQEAQHRRCVLLAANSKLTTENHLLERARSFELSSLRLAPAVFLRPRDFFRGLCNPLCLQKRVLIAGQAIGQKFSTEKH